MFYRSQVSSNFIYETDSSSATVTKMWLTRRKYISPSSHFHFTKFFWSSCFSHFDYN